MSANSTVSCFSFLKRPGATNLHKIYRLNGKDSKNELKRSIFTGTITGDVTATLRNCLSVQIIWEKGSIKKVKSSFVNGDNKAKVSRNITIILIIDALSLLKLSRNELIYIRYPFLLAVPLDLLTQALLHQSSLKNQHLW